MNKIVVSVLACLAMAGCSRNIAINEDVIRFAKMGCEAYNSKMQDVTVKDWFPTFTQEIVFSCEKEGSKTMIVSIEETK